MNCHFPCIRVASFAAGLLFQLSTAPAQESGTPRERTTVEYTKALSLQDPAELLRLGTEAYEHGYFSQCLALWPRAWEAGRDAAEENIRALSDRAFAEWMRMLSRLGRTAELRAGLASVDGRVFRGGTAEMVQVARDSLWVMENKPGVSFRCGPHALQRILMHSGAANMWPMEIITSESPPEGIALKEVSALSAKVGMNYQMARRVDAAAEIPVPAIVHWKLDHYGAVVKKEGSRYLLDDPTFGNGLMWISEEALRSEGSGCFLLPPGPLPNGWEAIGAEEGARITGLGYTNSDQPGSSGPGNPKPKPTPPNPPPGEPEDPDCGGAGGGGGGSDNRTPNDGMAGWSVSLMMASLEVSDIPVGYRPPVGPAIFFPVQYNQRETNQPPVRDYANFGPLWNCDWIGSLTFDSTTAYYNRGQGGIETFTGFDSVTQSYAPGYLLANRLVKISNTNYELRRPDGGKLVFALPDNATTPTRIFITQVVDPQGNAAVLTYDGTFRLTGVKDAINQTSTLTYGTGAETLLVKKITDPFGRFATFDYDGSGRLAKITDVIGLTSEFTYATGDVMQTLKTGYGTTTFNIGAVNSNRFVEVTHPNGEKERFEQRNGGTPGIPSSVTAALQPKGFAYFNNYLDGRNTFHWDRKAMKEAPGDYTRARLYHFMHHDLGTRSPILESSQLPGENRVWYNYQGQNNGGFYNQGMMAQAPARTARVLDNGSTQIWQKEFNALGRLTSSTDPLGRQVTFNYAPNGVDVIEVRRKTGAADSVRLASLTYNSAHRLLTFTQAGGEVTTAQWNARGQLTSSTNPKNETTTLNYNASGYLTSIDRALPGAGDSISFTYDAAGLTRTVTMSDGFTETFTWDALRRLTRVTYPDNTYEEIAWQLLHPASWRDRLGRVTAWTHDALGQMTTKTDPLNRVTRYEWCRCGGLKAMIDPMNRPTRWLHDVAGRVTAKIYADDSRETYAYDRAGRLVSVTDPRGQIKVFTWLHDDKPGNVAYQNAAVPTPGVNYAWDPWFPRLTRRTDGGGTTQFSYRPFTGAAAGRLMSEDGPLANDTTTWSWDVIGRLTGISIGASAQSIVYDALGRMTRSTSVLGQTDYLYDGATPRVSRINLPNGTATAFDYFPGAGDFRLQRLRHLAADTSVLSEYGVTWDAAGRLLTRSVKQGAAAAVTHTAGYDAADRLTAFAAPGDTRAFTWDTAGNRLTETINGTTTTATFNVLNELTNQSSSAVPARTYEWDGQNRLAAIAYTGSGRRTEFTHDAQHRCVRILEKDGASVTADRRFVWCGLMRCEERNATGAVVRRFFSEGEQIGSTACFYFRDHLGSVRDLRDGSALRARYDYDAWGRRTRTTGDLEALCGFTGHFVHADSGLQLAPYRAYDASTARWLNRDPLQGAELRPDGPSLYSYAGGSPLDRTDPLGLFFCKIRKPIENSRQWDDQDFWFDDEWQLRKYLDQHPDAEAWHDRWPDGIQGVNPENPDWNMERFDRWWWGDPRGATSPGHWAPAPMNATR